MTVPSSRPQYVDEAEGRAAALREELGLGSDAVGDAFELLGHFGLQVLRWPMGEYGPDGFYVRKGELAVVAVNSAKRVARQRFTAYHELGHHLFDHQSRVDSDVFGGTTVPERRANAFAAFILLPREGVRRWLNREGRQREGQPTIDAESIVHLARHFGMSFEATLYQLRDLGWLRPRDLDTLKASQPERIARRLGYDVDLDEQESGRRVLPPDFVRRALQLYGSGDISLMRLAELLRVDEEAASRFAVAAGIEPTGPSLDELIEESRRA